MKKISSLFLALVIVMSMFNLYACSNDNKESEAVPSEVAVKVLQNLKWNYTKFSKEILDGMTQEDREARIAILYGDSEGFVPDFSIFDDYVILVPEGEMDAREIGIFKLNKEQYDEKSIEDVKSFIKNRTEMVKLIFESYDKDAAKMAENATVKSWGRYIFYAIADDSEELCKNIEKEIINKAV